MDAVKTFNIYHKPDSFYWSRTWVIYASILLLILTGMVMHYLLKVPEEHVFYDLLVYTGGALFFSGIPLKMRGLVKLRPLKGRLEGYISFTHEAINVGDASYPIDEITRIEFEGADWLGLYIHSVPEYFENSLSQGVENFLLLHLISGQTIRTQFQLIRACELQDVEEYIVGYYLKDKVSYLQTVDHLCLSTTAEWEKLKQLKREHNH